MMFIFIFSFFLSFFLYFRIQSSIVKKKAFKKKNEIKFICQTKQGIGGLYELRANQSIIFS